jgi:hypothetical protein
MRKGSQGPKTCVDRSEHRHRLVRCLCLELYRREKVSSGRGLTCRCSVRANRAEYEILETPYERFCIRLSLCLPAA